MMDKINNECTSNNIQNSVEILTVSLINPTFIAPIHTTSLVASWYFDRIIFSRIKTFVSYIFIDFIKTN